MAVPLSRPSSGEIQTATLAVYARALEQFYPADAAAPQGRILSVGCGRATDALVQRNAAAGLPLDATDNAVSYFGIDIHPCFLDSLAFGKLYSHGDGYTSVAPTTFSDTARSPGTRFIIPGSSMNEARISEPGYTFICGDARNLNELVEGTFDATFFSHPGPLSLDWEVIFAETLKQLRPSGVFFATTYSVEEALTVSELVAETNPVLRENTYSASLVSQGMFQSHRFVVIGRKE